MFIKALLAFLALPGIFGFVVPTTLGIADPWRGEWNTCGAVLTFIGVLVLLWCVRAEDSP